MSNMIAEIVSRHIEQGTKADNDQYVNTTIEMIEKAIRGEQIKIIQEGDDFDDSDTIIILARRFKVLYEIIDGKKLILNPTITHD